MATSPIALMTYAWAGFSVITIFVAMMNLLESSAKVIVAEPEQQPTGGMLRVYDLVKDAFFLFLVLFGDLVEAILTIALLGPLSSLGVDIRYTLRGVELLVAIATFSYMLWARFYRRVMLAASEKEAKG
jgi:hypothetical protein